MILALDVGLAKLGYSLLNKNSRIIKTGIIKTDGGMPLEERMKNIYDSLDKIIRRDKVKQIIAEKFYPHSLTSKNLSVLFVYGVILLLAAKRAIKIFSYNPKDIKKFITGYGNASKSQVEKMLKRIYGINLPRQKDVADAVSIALYHAHLSKTKKCYRF